MPGFDRDSNEKSPNEVSKPRTVWFENWVIASQQKTAAGSLDPGACEMCGEDALWDA